MPRPEIHMITFTVDGREVRAPENAMLVDAAKLGDVEIPVFCYEPKLGQPVGACRMCLVEIEGIPKLQTGCSTPVKDGMVVITQSERVKEAQEAIVEFLLVNHPLDCPVCDKGGECPLQDISFGWGGGRSRFIEPKRHFEKPLALSPLIAIDRERCILCYRCVRFSQEISEDYQLILAERSADTYVSTFDGHPYVAPFSGNIIELCPVGALTSQPYRFRARPWDIEGAGSVCTLCPAQCNVELTVRDERVLRVLARQHPGVDDGWLCDKGRFAYQSVHVDERITRPMVREGGELRPVSWERALDEAAGALGRAGAQSAVLAGGGATNEEGYLLQRLAREAVGTPHVDSRAGGGPGRELAAALGAPALQATVPDLEHAHAVLVLETEPVDDMPIVDLRIRKGVRRNRVRLAVATPRPSSLDRNADVSVRYAPGCGEAFVAALSAMLGGEGKNVDELASSAGTTVEALRGVTGVLRGVEVGEGATGSDEAGPRDIVILWGERLTQGRRGAAAARGLLNVAARLRLGGREGAGLLEVPVAANGRGLREAGVLHDAGPGLSEPPHGEMAAIDGLELPDGLARGDLTTLLLWDAEVDAATLAAAGTVIAHAAFLTDALRAHATVVLPAESYAEKEGTVTHPDGRVQRLRPAIGRQGGVRPGWQVLADLMARVGATQDPADPGAGDPRVLTGPMASRQLFEAVPVYAGLTLEELGGRGVRWPAREQAAAWPRADAGPFGLEVPPGPVKANGDLRLGTFRSIWAGPEVGHSPALRFLVPKPRVEMAPADAQRRNVTQGDHVTVGHNGAALHATVVLRDAVPRGTVFVETDALRAGPVDVRKAPPRAGPPAPDPAEAPS
ncbi:MAG: NADH-quinone oxidoreductase subunit NuoG [Solirubrobacteraceae bacterium MAG38_C4-C5]|nr:NADH-quinone oxidoreductase subunit NuoG [Candidatus Siliceabacter maunaloa]